jgi:geranylgeranyl diphosphate synthase type II
MYTIKELQEIVKKEIATITFPENPRRLYEPIEYTLELGGKRLRPVLALMSCDMFEGDINEVIPAAIGIEIFHNFTLLHDDIMDNAPIRRGMPTVYRKWNSNVAILSGDTMFAEAYKYVSKTKREILPEVLDVFNQTAIEVCEGQQYDMDFETSEEVSIPEYMEMIRLKTAVLLGCSLKAGALIGGASEEDLQNIYDFGINIGLAFQLKDDWLDSFGDEAVFGKKTGGDILENKKTYLCLKAFELAQGKDKDDLQNYYSSTEFNAEEKIERIKEIFTNCGADKFVEGMMEEYYQKALKNLDNLKIDEARKAEFISFAKYLIHRDK